MNRVVQTTVRGIVASCFVAVLAAGAAGAGVNPNSDSPGAIRHSRRIALPDPPDSVALSGDGKTIAVASGKILTVIDATTGKQQRRWEQTVDIVGIALSTDGQLVAVATGSPIIDVYDRDTGERSQQLHRTDTPHFLRNDGQERIAFYPDGAKLISNGTKKRIYVSDVKTGDWDHILFVKYPTCTPLVSPDGRHVALFGSPDGPELSGQVTIYKVRRGLQPLWTKWHESEEAVTHAAFSPDGARLVTTGAGDGVRVWDVESGEQLAHIAEKPKARPLGVSFVTDGMHLLTASPRGLRLRKVEGGEVLASMEVAKQQSLRGFACSRDGAVVVTFAGDAALDLWSVKDP